MRLSTKIRYGIRAMIDIFHALEGTTAPTGCVDDPDSVLARNSV